MHTKQRNNNPGRYLLIGLRVLCTRRWRSTCPLLHATASAVEPLLRATASAVELCMTMTAGTVRADIYVSTMSKRCAKIKGSGARFHCAHLGLFFPAPSDGSGARNNDVTRRDSVARLREEVWRSFLHPGPVVCIPFVRKQTLRRQVIDWCWAVSTHLAMHGCLGCRVRCRSRTGSVVREFQAQLGKSTHVLMCE